MYSKAADRNSSTATLQASICAKRKATSDFGSPGTNQVPIFRHTSDAEVEEAIRTAFHGITPPLHQWEVLDCFAKKRLCTATSKVGYHGLSAEHVIERRGGLYLAQVSDEVSTLIIMSIMYALAGACVPGSVVSHKVIVIWFKLLLL